LSGGKREKKGAGGGGCEESGDRRKRTVRKKKRAEDHAERMRVEAILNVEAVPEAPRYPYLQNVMNLFSKFACLLR